ncbi:MAG: amphi-Trp domain-containing protein [Deltaproteobacteria bacterium]|jgi:amphi-Trp domain-containing protein|nr:amphi-Trp domain-containing protein [Deltaproteobacteria bacterium]
MSRNNFRHSFTTDPEDVARYLEALTEGFRGRNLTFRSQQRKVALEPAGVMDMSIETSARRGRVRVTLAFSWAEEEGPAVPPLPLDGPFPGR